MRVVVLTIAVFLTLLSISCNDERVDTSTGPQENLEVEDNGESIGSQTLVSYSTHIKPIMEAYCVSCHNEEAVEASALAPSDFTTFEGARPYGSLMPTFRLFAELNATDQQTITDWIDNGLTEADYDNGVKLVLDTNCISCHPPGAEARKELPKTNLYIEATVKLYGSLLPQFGKLKGVSPDEQKILETWVEQGLQ